MIGSELKKIRKTKGLTLEQVAGTFMSISRLSNIENNKTSLDAKTREYLKTKLDLSDDFFVSSIETTKNRNLLDQARTLLHAQLTAQAVPLLYRVYDDASEEQDYQTMGQAALELGKACRDYKDYKESERWVMKGIQLFESINESLLTAEGYMILGVVSFRREHYHEAIEHFKHALTLSEDGTGLSFKGKLYYNLASVYYKCRDSDHAAAYCEKALKALRERDTHYLIGVYNLQAILYAQMNMLLTAKEKCLEAKRLAESVQDVKLIGKCLHNLGFISFQLQDYSEALQTLNLSLDIKKANRHEQGMLRTEMALAAVCINQGKIKEAHKLLKNALSVARESHLLNDEMTCLNVYRVLCLKEGLFQDYLNYTFKALSLAERLEINETKSKICLELAGFYLETDNEQAYYDTLHEFFLLKKRSKILNVKVVKPSVQTPALFT